MISPRLILVIIDRQWTKSVMRVVTSYCIEVGSTNTKPRYDERISFATSFLDIALSVFFYTGVYTQMGFIFFG